MNHCALHQKLKQHCKPSILQLNTKHQQNTAIPQLTFSRLVGIKNSIKCNTSHLLTGLHGETLILLGS